MQWRMFLEMLRLIDSTSVTSKIVYLSFSLRIRLSYSTYLVSTKWKRIDTISVISKIVYLYR